MLFLNSAATAACDAMILEDGRGDLGNPGVYSKRASCKFPRYGRVATIAVVENMFAVLVREIAVGADILLIPERKNNRLKLFEDSSHIRLGLGLGVRLG